MKRTAVLSILMIVLSAGLVAAQPWTADDGAVPELRTLEGRLQLEDGERPLLIADGEEYVLRIHRTMASELAVRDGQTVTVEGYVVTVPGRDLLGDDLFVGVRAFEADGTRVVIPDAPGAARMGAGIPGGARGRMGAAPRGGFGAAGPQDRRGAR